MDERFASVLEDAFPGREIAETIESSADERNETISVEFADGERVFCKRAIDGNGSRLETERAVLEYVDANRAVPVPSVVASDVEGPVPYLVTAPLAGEPLAAVKDDPDGPGEETAMRTLGRALAKLHAEEFDAHGEITGGSTDHLEIDSGSWTAVFVEQVRGIREFARSNRFDRYLDDVIAAIEANREVLDAAPAALVHTDPNDHNCYYGERGVGFLDWEYAHVGDPARDLHRVLEQQFGYFRPADPDRLVAALHEGYREQAGQLPDGFPERRPIYEVVRLLAAAAFFESKVDAAEESRTELADWMDAEMERRLDAVR